MKRLIFLLVLLLTFISQYALIDDPFGEPVIYGSGMNIRAKVLINGVPASTNDILIAQVGNQIRAKTNLINLPSSVGGVGRTFLIQSVISNEDIVFKVWKYSQQKIYTASVTLQSSPGTTFPPNANIYYTINANTATQTVSGYVKDELLNPLANIPINISSINPSHNFDAFTTLKTNSLGEYLIPGINNGTDITFSPVSPQYTFSPVQQSYTNINNDYNCNFIGIIIPQYTATGSVTANSQPFAGVSIHAGLFSTITNSLGNYTLSLPAYSNYIITASKDGWEFEPQSHDITYLNSNQSSLDFSGTPLKYTITGNTDIGYANITIISQNNHDYSDTVSDANGNFTINDIIHGDTVIITPTKEGMVFSPNSRTIANITSNKHISFTANQQTFTVSGNITENGAGLGDVFVNYQIGSTTSDSNGNFSFTLAWHESVDISFSKIAYRFTPNTINVTNIEEDKIYNITAYALQTFTISGFTQDYNNQAISDVILHYDNSSVISNQNGFYSINITEGQDITITPEKPGHIFSPQSISFVDISENKSQNFYGTLSQQTISGCIKLNGLPIAGCDIIVNNVIRGQTDISGQYSVQDYYGTSINLKPNHTNYTFQPTERNVILTDDFYNQDFQATLKTFTVTGNVTYNSQPLIGVLIRTQLARDAVLTDDNGNYSLNLSIGTSCSIIAEKDNFSFEPHHYSIDNISSNVSNRNFIASPHVISPSFTPEPGIYTSQQTIIITCATSDATIRYTLDNSDVDENSPVYSEPIIANTDTTLTIKAKAFKDAYIDSKQTTAEYIITNKLSQPNIMPESGVFTHSIFATMTAEENASIYYTKNGIEPSQQDSLYTQPIVINTDCTIKAKAFRTNYEPSNITEANYAFNHLLNLSLPDSVTVNKNSQITLNIMNYLDDSVSGSHQYHINADADDHINLSVNNAFITIIPEDEWIGSGFLRVNASFDNEVFVTDSTKIIVRANNSKPIITSYYPVEDTLSVSLNSPTNFIVNAVDYDNDDLFYQWFVNSVDQHIDDNIFVFIPNTLGEYLVVCKVTDLNYDVYKTWQVYISSDNADILKPKENYLSQNYPNPFNPFTTIDFCLKKDDYININVYNIKGQFIKTLLNEFVNAGEHSIIWDGTDAQGKTLKSGIYLYKISSSSFYDFKKAILLK
ncbi:MAG: chitobiase/beta-hexosaminidase C-terminal domain-containing protein [Candidatus Cloacimonetes bacterium]|nr:chitobiase/beta-hexosaminidase C-terminal domain-containing protein [Candidatus Cloacimonadota bacterium]